jgi:hypothetical protein
MKPTLALSALAALSLATPAEAAWPDDVSLSSLATWGGTTVMDESIQGDAYGSVVRQLALGIMNKPMAPAETVGLAGFDVAMTHTVAFIDANGARDDAPAPWERLHAEGTPTRALWLPGLSVRKGLPMSLEIGGTFAQVGFSHQTAIGGHARWAPMEGDPRVPDVCIQIGYVGYVGNEELDLGVMDTQISIGRTFAFGYLEGIHTGTVSPYAGLGIARIRAQPLLSEGAQDDLGIGAISGFASADSFTEGYAPLTLHGGIRVLSGDVQALANLVVSPGELVTLNTGLGFIY